VHGAPPRVSELIFPKKSPFAKPSAMKKITLNIEDDKFKAFLDYIEALDYVSVASEPEVPEWQQKEVEGRKEKHKTGQLKARGWNAAKNDIFKD